MKYYCILYYLDWHYFSNSLFWPACSKIFQHLWHYPYGLIENHIYECTVLSRPIAPFITPNSHITKISWGTDFSLYNNPFITPNSHTTIHHWFVSTKKSQSPDSIAKQCDYHHQTRWLSRCVQVKIGQCRLRLLNKHYPKPQVHIITNYLSVHCLMK